MNTVAVDIKNTSLSSFDVSHGEKQDELYPFLFFFLFHPFLHSLPLLFLHPVSSFTLATLIKAVKGLLTVTGIPIMKIPLPRSRESFWSRRLNEPIPLVLPHWEPGHHLVSFSPVPVSMSQPGRNPLPCFSDQISSALIFIYHPPFVDPPFSILHRVSWLDLTRGCYFFLISKRSKRFVRSMHLDRR